MTEPFDWNTAPDTRDTRPERETVVYACKCGQTTITPIDVCAACQQARNAPQGTQDALFTAPPAPMPGQIMGRWDPYQ